jgi:hypothetical protein
MEKDCFANIEINSFTIHHNFGTILNGQNTTAENTSSRCSISVLCL